MIATIGPWLKLFITYGPSALAVINQAVDVIKGINCPTKRKAALKRAVSAGKVEAVAWKGQTRRQRKTERTKALAAVVTDLKGNVA